MRDLRGMRPQGDAAISSDFVWKFEDGDADRSTYYLEWDPEQHENVEVVERFKVDEAGTINLPIKEGIFRLWARTDESSPSALPITEFEDWWLVTEHTLPNPQMEAGIRTLPIENF